MSDSFAQTYRAMSDDELLNTATQSARLIPEARSALADELRRRNLSQSEVAKYGNYLEQYVRQTMDGKPVPVTESYCGIGTGFYGKRNFRSDGSYVTTKFFIFFWIPVVPFFSFRVRKDCPFPWLSVFNRGYAAVSRSVVIEQLVVDRNQTICVYSFTASVLVALYLWVLVASSGPLHGPPLALAIGILLLFFLPFALRVRGKRRATDVEAS